MKMLVSGIVVAAAVTVAAAGAVNAKTIRIQTSANSGDFTYTYINETWVPKLERMSGGELEIKLLPIDAVVPAKESLDAMAAGVLDGVYNFVGRFAGKDPAYAILGDLVAAYDNPDQAQAFCMNGGGKEMLQKVHDEYTSGKVHVVGCGPFSREPLVAAKPIRGVDDLKGVKIRAPQGLSSLLFEEAGATPVPIPYSEIYTALDKGIIEAANGSSYSNNAAAGLYRLAPYPLYPGIESQAVIQFALNERVWSSFSDAQQAMLETWYYAMSTDVRRASGIKGRELVAKHRNGEGPVKEVIDWPQSERNKLRDIAKGAWKEMASRSPLAEEAYQKQLDFIRMYGLVD